MLYQNVYIESLVHVRPEIEIRTQSIENDIAPLYRKLGLKPGWLQAVTGIRERRFWPVGYKPSDVAVLAAKKALNRSSVAKSQVGALVSCSVCKDYIEPSVAAGVHGKLGLPTTAHNYDVGNTCLGF